MNKNIIDSIKENGHEPISDGHTSERIWYKGKYIEYYRVVMANALGIDPDKLPEDMYVHHIDGDRMNNDLDNLMIGTRRAHERLELLMDPKHYNPK